MANTTILTSIHGRLIGVTAAGKLALGKSAKLFLTQRATGAMELVQPTPAVLNTTGTLTAAMLMTGLVTSTTAAAVVATLDTGAIMNASFLDMAVDDAIEWTAIATGANAFTVTAAASGHTIVGSGVVATGTSKQFRTRKTAADTFVTYNLG
jgi:hypothetical protein